jgi:hypothetical protein
MQTSPTKSGRRGVNYAAAAALVILLAGTVFAVLGFRGATPPNADTPAARSTAPASEPAERPSRSERRRNRPVDQPDFGRVLAGSAPTGITIPRIGVRAARFVGLGLAVNGEIEVPRDAETPGWFTPGPSPGQLGPAVIAGHVDSTTGPALFYRLSELRPGDRVLVDRRDGSVATFTIDRVESFEKEAFPTRDVYGPTPRSELRLITCGGRYDDRAGYLSNTVAFAHLI